MVKIKGFTLIELMIVIAIIAILATLAYPSYQEYVKRTKRVEAQTELIGIAQKLVSYKLANGSFYGATLVNTYGANFVNKSGSVTYNLNLSDTTSNPTHSWILKAIPISGQKDDGALTITHNGTQCWYKGKDDASGVCLSWTDR